MSYVDAPATALVATRCACCSRPLVDACSVETGVGPECRKRHGLADGPVDNRVMANLLVYAIAVEQDGNGVVNATNKLRELGFTRLADRIAARLANIAVEREADLIIVRFPYSEDANEQLRGWARWDRKRKAWTTAATNGRKLLNALKSSFPGQWARGPKGIFAL